MKSCCMCLVSKNLEYFFNRSASADGKDSYCKKCRAAIKKSYYKRNKTKVNKKNYLWFKSLRPEQKNIFLKSAKERQPRYQAKRNAIEAKRRFNKRNATPTWLSESHLKEIERFYWFAKDLKTVSGQDYHVDHIIPLKHKNICGLHVPWNLQILPSDVNISKSNSYEGY